jgi:PAS domain S-box-containing protein
MPDRKLTDELLRSAIAAAPDGIVVVDAHGRIEVVNPMTLTLFGYEADELIGEPIEILVPDAERDEHVTLRDAYIAHPHTRAMGVGLQLFGRRRNGSEFPVEVSLSPVPSTSGTRVIAIVRDVTEKRASAQELMAAHEQLALLDDRERIARDLHDTVIQRLFAVGLALQGALLSAPDAKLQERIELAIDEIDGTIRDIRTAIFSLHSRRAPTAGLRDDVLATAREAGRALGFEPQVTFDGPVDSATVAGVREQLMPALREALSNVVKHAHATRVSVAVRVADADIVLEIVDDGIGVTGAPHGGRGITNINERASALGGKCTVVAAAEGGTVVTWRVPAVRSQSGDR